MENENKVLEERKEKLIHFLKADRLFSTFLIISIVSLIFSGLVKIGISPIISVFSPFVWLMLAIFSAISAAFVYFNKRQFAFYPLMIWTAILSLVIRTLNTAGLRDITTGGWTLGPDLDPFLFLRWGKYIVEHGAIMAHDAMRYVPLGFDTSKELLVLPYSIAYFHKLASIFGSESVTQSAALLPAFAFMLGVVAFFFLTKKALSSSFGEQTSSWIAVIASFFVSVMPVFIPRTIAGIPEKESIGIPFMFAAFCFFLYAWDAKKTWSRVTFALLAGISTALMALSWGGYIYIYATLGAAVLVAFILGKVDFERAYLYAIWVISSFAIIFLFTNRYSLQGLIASPTTGLSVFVLGIIIVDMIISKTRLKDYLDSPKLSKVPKPLISLIIAAGLGVIAATVLFGPHFIIELLADIKSHLITPIVDRLGLTVAENRQPYFSEWASSFGPYLKNIPITFWLFFIGSVFLFWKMVSSFARKDRIVFTISYLIFIICLIFSRYSQTSLMNGTSALSVLVYFIGFIALAGAAGYYYFTYYKKGEFEKIKEISFGLIWIIILFVICLVSARGAIRLTMMLVPPISIIISAFAVLILESARNQKSESSFKVITWIIAVLVLLSTVFAAYQLTLGAEGTAQSYVPAAYNQQWQKAMSWVRDNTPQNAVFGHWWDYGYWLQSIGDRATVLDGGNSLPYWDYLMGRYGLTGRSDSEALEFLYTHNTTHFLIDSSDIGKYPAFSSIGSDENYDRYSWLTTFVQDTRQTQETKNSTLVVYSGGFPLDGDIIYDNDGAKIFLPEAKAGLGAIVVERDNNGKITKNPIGIFVYQGKQVQIPLRYAYDDKLIDFGEGLDAGIFLYPMVSQDSSNQGISINQKGALIYLSDKTVMSQLARLYLYKEDNKFFELVHSEDDFVVAQLKSQNATNSDIVYYQGIRGPIRIWEINYPANVTSNPDYLATDYLDERVRIAKQ